MAATVHDEINMTPIDIAKDYIRAVQTGDHATLSRLMAPDIVWHQPGRNRFSGEHRGPAAVGNMISGMMQVSAGTFAISRAVRFMENGGWVAVDIEFQAHRNGMGLAQSGIDLLRIENDRIVEARLFSSDQNAEDAFWGR
jgi:ketosteroid isomerase-like protein